MEVDLLLNIVKSLLMLTLLSNSSYAHLVSYDDDVLEIFSKILPRFVLMSDKKNHLQDELKICIVRDEIDAPEAAILIDKINSHYPNGLKNYKLRLLESNFLNLSRCEGSQMIFLFNSSKKQIDSSVDYANKNHLLSVSYNNQLLENGVEISLFLGRKIVPYINIEEIEKNGIALDNLLLRISKIYKKTDE